MRKVTTAGVLQCRQVSGRLGEAPEFRDGAVANQRPYPHGGPGNAVELLTRQQGWRTFLIRPEDRLKPVVDHDYSEGGDPATYRGWVWFYEEDRPVAEALLRGTATAFLAEVRDKAQKSFDALAAESGGEGP
jgi:hypothetical protein